MDVDIWVFVALIKQVAILHIDYPIASTTLAYTSILRVSL